ncbi:MAG: hypothetical protein KGI54_16260 [Pseudomonadota bacterium]|nr:hypothetical protein [Pseudomonadota bacterium]
MVGNVVETVSIPFAIVLNTFWYEAHANVIDNPDSIHLSNVTSDLPRVSKAWNWIQHITG